MRKRRILSFALILCVMATMLGSFTLESSAANDPEWSYDLRIKISTKRDSGCKNGNVRAKFEFESGDEYITLNNTNEKGGVSVTSLKTTRAPWTLKNLVLINETKDGFRMQRITLSVFRTVQSGLSIHLFTHSLIDQYPNGSGDSDGKWIQTDDGDKPTHAISLADNKRSITGYGNFSNFANDMYINSHDESGTEDFEYDGMITDTKYSLVSPTAAAYASEYYCLSLSEPPVYSYEVHGFQGDGTVVTKSQLTSAGAIANKGNYGFTVDRKKLMEYMNEKNLNHLKITSKLAFPRADTTTSVMNICRNIFAVSDELRFSTNYHTAMKDNNYYNNSGSKRIDVTLDVINGDLYTHYNQFKINYCNVVFDEAYLELGDTGKKIYADEKSSKIINCNFTLSFPYTEGMDSNNKGLKLVIKGARISPNYYGEDQTIELWDVVDKKLGFEKLSSAYKLDAVNPTVKVTAKDGASFDKWNKQIALDAIPSETTYAVLKSGEAAKEGYFIAELYDGQVPVQIRNVKSPNSSSAYVSQPVNSRAGSASDFTLALAEKKEGIFTLRMTGADFAGNALNTAVGGIRLDNKAPVITLKRTNGSDSVYSKEAHYGVTITDASGTGRMYYCFADSASIPNITGQNPQKHTSGAINSLINQWAFIDQSDIGAAVYLTVPKGENFSGRLAWYGVDDFGNATAMSYEDINIINEDSRCDITSVESTLTANPNYTVSVSTNEANRVRYKWTDAFGKDITDYADYTGAVSTAADMRTNKLDGTYTFKCELTMPSGAVYYPERSFVFDNSVPKLNITPVTPGEYKDLQAVSVYSTDSSGVAGGEAVLLAADGAPVDGMTYPLSVNDGIVSQNVNITGVPSGAYKLKVSVTDIHGNAAEDVSDIFRIRSGAPAVQVSVTADKEFSGLPLITEASPGKMKISAHEDFSGAADAAAQSLWYRVSTDPTAQSSWIKAGDMTAGESGFDGEFTVDMPQFTFADGENKLFVQTAVCADGTDMTKLNTKFITSAEVVILSDSTAPQTRLVIDDIHTSGSISGVLYATDNIGGEMTAVSNDANVEVTRRENETGIFDIKVNENTDSASDKGTMITVTDLAGNMTEVPIDISGIDREAPTAEIKTWNTTSGERQDAKAKVTVHDAAADKIYIVFIKAEELDKLYDGEKFSDACFEKTVTEDEDGNSKTIISAPYDGDVIALTSDSFETARWDGEVNATYSVRLGGYTGTYYVGVRAQDSVGNSADMLLDGVLSANDAQLTYTAAAAPAEADKVSVINLDFNQNVYLLGQDSITDKADTDSTVDETNLGIAARNAGSYSQKHSLTIRKNGEYKLYTVDDIGRRRMFTLNADESLVKFGAVDNSVTATTFWDGTEVKEGEMAPVWSRVGEYGLDRRTTVEVTPDDPDMRLMPLDADSTHSEYGLYFLEDKSADFMDEHGHYKKLIYDVQEKNSESPAGLINVRIFMADNADETTWGSAVAVVNNIDYTAPKINYTMTPEIYVFDDEGNIIIEKTTPQDVTVYITMQDAETGLSEIKLGSMHILLHGPDGEPYFDRKELPALPLVDESGNAIDYSANPYKWSGESDGIPVTVEYAEDADLKAAKMVKFVFSADCVIDEFEAINGVGNGAWFMLGRAEMGMDIHGIYKMPIEEGKDFTVNYYYETDSGSWEPMADTSAYCRRAKAVIELSERGSERGLYVRNNGGRLERELDSYDSRFTFEFRDKYGYSASKDVSAENFDTQPGTIDYILSETEKTNKPITLTVTATDGGSGIGRAELASGGSAAPLAGKVSGDGKSGTYTASIDKNGAYSIVLYDKVGNRTSANFTVSNLDMDAPKLMSVTLSTPEDVITSRNVSASLVFSKPNVRITSVEPSTGVTETDYSVSYSSNVITFSKSGTVTVNFADDSGNTGTDAVTVSNIDKNPPALAAKAESNTDMSEVTVTFDKALTPEGMPIDSRRELSDITVSYGGIAMRADEAKFVFYENGIYTFKVYDDEGLSSYITLELDQKYLDKSEPVIKEIRWSYDYETENGIVSAPTRTVTPNKAGYRIGTKKIENGLALPDNHVTNRDVTVTVVTDSDTRQVGSNGEYAKENQKIYSGNGLYIFNMEKRNKLTDTFGVDVEIIDKTPPVIELIGGSEMIFYENSASGESYTADKRDRIETAGTAFKAYDSFGGGIDLSGRVQVIYDASHPFDPMGANNVYDSSAPYTVTYRVHDDAYNMTEIRRTIRLIGMYDTMALINGKLPDSTGTCEVQGDTVSVELRNFSPSGTAYVRYSEGIRTMGQMKTDGTILARGTDGKYTVSGLESGWYTFYIQTDKRDYFTICTYLY